MRIKTTSQLQIGDIVRRPDSPDLVVTDLTPVGKGITTSIKVEFAYAKPFLQRWAGPLEQFVVLTENSELPEAQDYPDPERLPDIEPEVIYD